MHHFVATAPWDAQEIMKTARDYALEEFAYHGGVEAWILDDTAYPKKGRATRLGSGGSNKAFSANKTIARSP